MRKLIILLSVITLAGFTANAQQFKLGAKAGVNFSAINVENNETRVGFNGGFLAQYITKSGFAIQPELLYSSQGAKAADEKVNLNYLNIPVMLQYYIVPGFNLEAGPQIGFLMSAKYKWEDDSEDIADQCNKVDFGVSFGAAYEIPSIGLGFFARYNLGLTDILKNVSENAGANRVFQLGAFVKF